MSTARETHSQGYAAFRRDELVVALPHLRQVRLVLRLAGVDVHVEHRSAALDLALLSVPKVDAAADKIETWLALQHVDPPEPRPTDRAIDRLLAGLRAYFADRHAGWCPLMGKNRLVGAVNGGGGAISHGGGGVPVVTADRLPDCGWGPGQQVRVGVLDTALAPQPWLSGGWQAGYSDLLPETGQYQEGAGHATFVTGLILSQAPGASVVLKRVLTPDEDGEYTADCWTVAHAIVELGTSGIDVLNLSLVCYTEDGLPPLLLSAAVSRVDRDVVIVAAAGNHGTVDHQEAGASSKPTFPAALDGVVAVGAADLAGRPAAFTPLNRYWIDLLAAGVDVLGPYLSGKVRLNDGRIEDFDGVARWSGSSFAAALVSGAVAAGVQPGRVTARQSLADIARAVGTGRKLTDPDRYVPPFVPLRLLERHR